MNSTSLNQKAWEHSAYKFWTAHLGPPEKEAQKILDNPKKLLRRYLPLFPAIEGKRILCPLGSCGRRSLALSLLGAEVTHLDFSEGNIQYAREMCAAVNQDMVFVYQDFMSYNGNQYDVCFMEGGILHYFHDLDAFVRRVRQHIKPRGTFILNDFHPFRKVFSQRDIFASDTAFQTTGDYFDTDIHEAPVAYERFMKDTDLPKCALRYYTFSEILNALVSNGLHLIHMNEGPRFDAHKHLPGDFTVVLKAV